MRVLLAVVALSGVALYVLIVRPTVVAKRLVKSVEQGDHEAAYELFPNPPQGVDAKGTGPSLLRMYAEIVPRDPNNRWTLERRVLLRLHFLDDTGGRYVDWTEDFDVVVGPLSTNIAGPALSELEPPD
jgi:hypothetical protein